MAQRAEASGWKNRDVIDILDFSREELLELFGETDRMLEEGGRSSEPLKGKIVATAFFEPSTRTRLSFTSAALRLGANVIDLSAEVSSLVKGESFADTIRMLEAYSDLIVVRHPSEGAALFASEISSKPVINGGDGSQHHPTQAMLDLYTITRLKGGVDGLTYAVVGDLKYARTATSFLYALTKFRPKKVYGVCPELLRPRQEVLKRLEALGLNLEMGVGLEEIVGELDVIYVTRIQKERFPDPSEYEKVRGSYRIGRSLVEKAKPDCIILHPLPRVDELPYEVDSTPHAAYFKQAAWGVPLRMALLKLILSG